MHKYMWKTPGETEILNVGMQAGMKKQQCLEIMKQIKLIVDSELAKYI